MANRLRTLRSLALLFCAGTLLAGCAQSTGDHKVVASPPPAYLLDGGDRIKINIFGEDMLNGEYNVGPDGTVALPLVGNVPARGGSIQDLQDAIRTRLSPRYLRDPRVSVEVVNFRPFYILGEVTRPGSYPYVEALSVTQAVAIAGGYSYRANTAKIFIRRADEQEEHLYLLKSGAQLWVKPGDTIRVGERLF